MVKKTSIRKKTASTEITVKFGRTGGVVSEYLLDDGKSVEDLLEMANADFSKGDRVRLNGDVLEDLETVLEAGDIVTMSSKVSGGLV